MGLQFLPESLLVVAAVLLASVAGAHGQLQGIGATFPASLYTTLAAAYSGYDPTWGYAYTGTSSGAGRNSLAAGGPNLTWAASDTIPSATTFVGPGNVSGQFVPVPSVMSCIAVVYHLSVQNLTLTRQNVADIFTGKIAVWNDARLVHNNPGLANISTRIQTIVRSGSSGTTSNFQYALNQFDPTLNLPAPRVYPISSWGTANQPFYGSTNTIVSDAIQVSPFTIGYVDYPDAFNTLASLGSSQSLYAIANVVNRNGDVVAPSMSTMNIALSASSSVNISGLQHLTADIGTTLQQTYIDTSVRGAYPLMAPTFFFLRQDSVTYNVTEQQMRATLRFLFWIVFGGTESRPSNRSTASPSTIPYFSQDHFVHFQDPSLRAFALDALKLITHNGKALYDPNSPCNPYIDSNGTYISANSCQNGYCPLDGPFQDSSVAQCICDIGYINNLRTDCSEPSAPLMILTAGVHQFNIPVVVCIGAALCVNIVILALLFAKREHSAIKSISPNCCYVIVLGSMFGQIGALFYTAEPSGFVCSARVFFPAIAFSSVFSMLLMKSIRIYIIFGYKKLRAIKASDTKLILATLAVVVLEIALCAVWVLVERPMAETGGVLYATVCASSGSSVAVFESLLYIINGLVVLGCVGFAYLTRGAHERFKESKTIAVCSYAVAGAVILGLPLAYILAGNSDSSTMFFSGRLVIVCLILGASTLVPIALFSSRLVRAIRTDADDGPDSQVPTRKGSFQASSDTKGAAAADVTVYAYECGVQGLKFGGAWASSNVLVLSMLDLIEFREPGSSGAIQASFRLSECECQLQEPSTGADKESASSKTVLLRRNKKAIVIEFESSEAAEMFLDNHRDAKTRPATFKTAGVGFLANNPKRDDGIFGMVGKANSITRSKSFNGSISSNHLDTQVVNSANNLSSTNNVNSANNLNTGFSLAGNQTLSVNAAAMPATPTRRHSAHGAIPKIMRTSEL